MNRLMPSARLRTKQGRIHFRNSRQGRHQKKNVFSSVVLSLSFPPQLLSLLFSSSPLSLSSSSSSSHLALEEFDHGQAAVEDATLLGPEERAGAVRQRHPEGCQPLLGRVVPPPPLLLHLGHRHLRVGAYATLEVTRHRPMNDT